MTRLCITPHRRLAKFRDDQHGGAMIELAMCVSLFLAMVFAIFDFGRMGSDYVMTEKALQTASRIAAVRPNACNGVVLPEFHDRAVVPTGVTPPRYGTTCRSDVYACGDPGPRWCVGDVTNPTFAEIWREIGPVMPGYAEPRDIRITYSFDPNLGFLGGPYTPMVTVELAGTDPSQMLSANNPPALRFQYIHPLGGLIGVVTGNGADLGDANGEIPFPPMSVSLPAEDLNQGTAG